MSAKPMRVTVTQQPDGTFSAMTDARHVCWLGATAHDAIEAMVNGVVLLIADGNMRASDPHAPVAPFARVEESPKLQSVDYEADAKLRQSLSAAANLDYLRRATWHEHYSRVLAGMCASHPRCTGVELPHLEKAALESTVRMHGPRPELDTNADIYVTFNAPFAPTAEDGLRIRQSLQMADWKHGPVQP